MNLLLVSQRLQRGFTLTELMIAIAVGAFVALAGATYYVTAVGAGKALFDTASQTEQVGATLYSIVADLRRAGYRGGPAQLSGYLPTTQGGVGTPGTEGLIPAVEFGSDGPPDTVGDSANCVLINYRRDHVCTVSDTVTDCALASPGDAVSVYHRFGYRLIDGVIEAVATVHPSEHGSGTTLSDSTCSAAGVSAWRQVTEPSQLFVDVFRLELSQQTIFDADNGCELGVTGPNPCSGYASYDLADCGATGGISCRIERLYKIVVCAYPSSEAGQCASAPEGLIEVEYFATPRNDVLIARSYP